MKRKRQPTESKPNKKVKIRDQTKNNIYGTASAREIPELPDNILWSIIEHFGFDKEIANFRLVCKQYARATYTVVPCYALMYNLLEDSKKYEANESLWFTALEMKTNEDLQYLIEGKSMPSPSEAPLLALQAIINARLQNKTIQQKQILYLLPKRSCAVECGLHVENMERNILVQGFLFNNSIFAMAQTNDEVLQKIFGATDQPFILHPNKDLQDDLISTVVFPVGYDEYTAILKPKHVTYGPTFNANEFQLDALQKMPKLPASVFKLLMKDKLSKIDENSMSKLLKAIEMVRWNTAWKFFLEEKMTTSDLLNIGTEDIKLLYSKLNITGVKYNEGNEHPEIDFKFTGIDGRFRIRNNHKKLTKDFILFFDKPVHYDYTSYLHLQRQIGFTKFLLPHDFVNLLYTAVGGKTASLHTKTHTSHDHKRQRMFHDVDPSCQVSGCQVRDIKYSTIMIKQKQFYGIVQILSKENSKRRKKWYCHIRIGKLTRSMIYPHFVSTVREYGIEDAVKSYYYWFNGLLDEGFSVLSYFVQDTSPWLYCERLPMMTKEILADSDEKKLRELDMPDNQMIAATKLKMQLKNDELQADLIEEQLQIDYSNFYVWMLKVKMLEKKGDIINTVRCIEVVLDMIEDEAEDIHEKLYFRYKFMKKYDKLKQKCKKYRSLSQEEALMLFIYHPASVADARNFQESSEEFKFGLDLLENAGESSIHLYPIQECAAKILKIKKFEAVTSTKDKFIKAVVDREGFFLPEHFYRVITAKTKASANVFWYFTHPMNIPSILRNGITVNEGHAAYFYSNFMNYAMAANEFGVLDGSNFFRHLHALFVGNRSLALAFKLGQSFGILSQI